jgi:hypothetical protein
MGGDNGSGFSDGFDETEGVEGDDLVVIHDGEHEHECVVLAIAELDGQEYALLAPREQLSEPGEDEDEAELELFIFQYGVNEEGFETYEGVDDPELFERVRAFFATLIETEDDEEGDLN